MAIRILHVVGGMNRGGIETYLMQILRQIDRQSFKMDFLVHTESPCAYDNEIRHLGSQIIPCLGTSKPWLYAKNFKRVLSEYGPYDIVHSHVHHFSGYVILLAWQAGIKARIVHSHIDSSILEAHSRWDRRLYLTFMKTLIAHYATAGIGCSKPANADLYGTDWVINPRYMLLYYGINLSPFKKPINVEEVRSELNLPTEAFVIGHVGRFDRQKNHQFLLEIFAAYAQQESQAYLLLVGEGTLYPRIKQQAEEMGIANRVRYTGSRSDVPRLMRGAMDLFLFPSLCEGLGIVLIEAQAAGLPSIISDVIPEEADLVKPIVRRLSLSQPAMEWAQEIVVWRDEVSKSPRKSVLELVEVSPYNIETSLQQLEKIYQAQSIKEVVL